MSVWPYPAPEDDGAARHLVRGVRVADVALRSTDGGSVSLAGGTGRTIVFVYPWTGRAGVSNPPNWDDIAGAHGSTPEAEGFRDHYGSYQALGVGVFGLSGQTPEWQTEFAERLQLPFALLSDADRVFATVMALPSFDTGGVRYLKRLTLVLASGRIERVFYPVHPPDRHAAEVLAYITSPTISSGE